MSKQIQRLCAWCLKPAFGRGDLTVALARPRAEAIELRWHLPGCADADPLHVELADALSLPDGADGEDVALAAYLNIVRRVRASGPDVLRGAVHVRRDFPDGALTLRGPGLLWGVQSRRTVRSGPRPRARR